MYLKNSLISFLKIKNIALLIIGVFIASVSVSSLISTVVYFGGNPFKIILNLGTFVSNVFLFLSVIMIAYSRISRKLINDACFFSEYFESDLNGYVDFEELAEVTGKTAAGVKKELKILRPLYMKNFRVIQTKNYQYPETIELHSKTVTCSCQSCGGLMEKRIYFTSVCPYCKSSDLTAQVVSGDRFYYIANNSSRKPNIPSYYQTPSLETKRIAYAASFGISLGAWLIMLIVFMTCVSNYNNQEYFFDMFGRNSFSFPEIQSGLMTVIIFNSFGMVSTGAALTITFLRMLSIESAQSYSRRFAECTKPFVTLPEIIQMTPSATGNTQTSSVSTQNVYKQIVSSIKDGYLRGCSPDKHNGTLRIALAKQIVQDRCSSCGAPIVGAITENYSCRYCRRIITGVIQKQ